MNTYYSEFINFFKKHKLYDEKTFNYIRQNSALFDYRDEDKRPYIGCYCIPGHNKTLSEIKLFVPYIDSRITVLINIHEYVHAIIFYKYLNKQYEITKEAEILPILYETLYILENPNNELEQFQIKLNNRIDEQSSANYKIALKVQKDLLEYYQKEKPTFKKLQTKAKKLSNKYQRCNR